MTEFRPDHPIWVTLLLLVGFIIAAVALFFLSERRFKKNRRLASMVYAILGIACGLMAVGHVIDLFMKL